MSITLQPGSSGEVKQHEGVATNPPSSPTVPEQKPGVFRVSAADVVKAERPALPRLQTFEELGIPDEYRKAVEQELTRDEKLVWLGRPSKNPEVYPKNTIVLAIVGGVVVGLALVLFFVMKGFALIFPVAMLLFGSLFLAIPWIVDPAKQYQACYVITNRRAILLECYTNNPAALLLERFLLGDRCKSYYPQQLLALECKPNSRVPGAGDLIFEYVFVVGSAGNLYPNRTIGPTSSSMLQRKARGFFFLDNVREVENVLRATLLDKLENKLDRE